MTMFMRRKHAIVSLDENELLDAIRTAGEECSIYVCQYPPEWSDDECKRFMLVVSEWILAGTIPPRPM